MGILELTHLFAKLLEITLVINSNSDLTHKNVFDNIVTLFDLSTVFLDIVFLCVYCSVGYMGKQFETNS